MLYNDYQETICRCFGSARFIPERRLLLEIAVIFEWDALTRPLSRKIKKEGWYKGRRRNPPGRPELELTEFAPLFVHHMIDNLTRCGIFVIEGDLWTFKGFPKGWRRKWKKDYVCESEVCFVRV